MSIRGMSHRSYELYARHVSAMTLHLRCLPTEFDPEQVKDYLFALQQKAPSLSLSYFKLTVYGLRFLLKMEGLPYSYLHLPPIKRSQKLPVVLSKEEMWSMLNQAGSLKHKILLALLYSCGLRSSEVRNIRLQDIDFDRMQLHIVRGKGGKGRYVPLSPHLLRGIRRYMEVYKPQEWLLYGNLKGRLKSRGTKQYSARGIQWMIKSICRKAGILKEVNVHSFRHTYATHLLEDGLDILTLQFLLGHTCLQTTMIYLRICQVDRKRAFSPLDTLFNRYAPRFVEREKRLLQKGPDGKGGQGHRGIC